MRANSERSALSEDHELVLTAKATVREIQLKDCFRPLIADLSILFRIFENSLRIAFHFGGEHARATAFKKPMESGHQGPR